MKKLLFLLAAPFVLISLSAQITQQEADYIARIRVKQETMLYTLHAKEEVQAGITLTTSTNEVLELEYLCWIYYVNYLEETNGKYLIVKENNGNLLEINVKNDTGPNDLEEWREVAVFPIEISFEEFFLELPCNWTNLTYPSFWEGANLLIIYNHEDLENYVSCTNGEIPDIDFSQYTLFITSGKSVSSPAFIVDVDFTQNDRTNYTLTLVVCQGVTGFPSPWEFAFLVPKMDSEAIIGFYFTYY